MGTIDEGLEHERCMMLHDRSLQNTYGDMEPNITFPTDRNREIDRL